MTLFIDSSRRNQIVLALDDVSVTIEKDPRTLDLLSEIVSFLQKNNKQIADISEIKIETEKGDSFTGLRSGVSIAQLISWFQNITINSRKIREDKFIKISAY